jgi:hypothetical protein
MREIHTRLDGIREVRTVEDPAVQRRVASAASLSETVARLTRELARS